ncbi:MAG: YidC/Oxa1 family membrane protein insertase [Lachnospiraceae bacterium]|nr:YidC/Oxa1 family membrane protein insertase [Lachnospiraceae bacterium]
MDGIYTFLSNFCGIDNVALVIFIFTIFIYFVLFPITYRTQKFSVLSRKMQPEISAVQKKYKGKKDQQSMQAMQEETQMIYDKYGISPMGSCVYMLIQMPILFALYRVFYNIPAYIGSVKTIFSGLVSEIVKIDGFRDKMQSVFDANKVQVVVDFKAEDTEKVSNYIIDFLYKLGDNGWKALSDAFPTLTDSIASTQEKLSDVNYFINLNISDTPFNLITTSWSADAKNWGIIIVAVLVPILAYLSQVINMRMTPTASTGDNADQMAKQMKTMNTLMPLMTLFFSFTVPVGLSIYWTAGAIVRTAQQIVLNKHFEKIDLDEIIEKNKEKAKAKQEKRGIQRERMMQAANMSTRNTATMSDKATVSSDKADTLDKAAELRKSAAKGSMASKANMVKEYNEKNSRK